MLGVAVQTTEEYFPPLKNAKSTLLEFCQGHGLGQPIYELIEKTGPDHNPLHKVRVILRANLGFENRFRDLFELSPKQKLEVLKEAFQKYPEG